MKTTLIALVVIGLVVIAGIVFVTANLSSANEQESIKSCSGCNNSCTKQTNCGIETCQAMQEKPCGCKRG